MSEAGDSSSVSPEVKKLVDHLFRRDAGQMVATLTRIFGADKIDLAEAVVQESLVKAMHSWSFNGPPENPTGWLIQVAKNLALDSFRRESNFAGKTEEIVCQIENLDRQTWFEAEGALLSNDFHDDQLKMMFVCCHPSINPSSQVALVLKILCGFSVEEISKAFLTKKETIQQRIVRAKSKIKDEGLQVEFPEIEELNTRLDGVLSALYLLFNEGYVSFGGPKLVKKEVCGEAIRLLTQLTKHPSGRKPKAFALLALFWFQFSRLDARTDSQGDLVLLQDQDREKWDRGAIQEGLRSLSNAAAGEELSQYHLEAGIAASHATSKSYPETDWNQIISYYQKLLSVSPSPVIFLNYAVAISERDGVKVGLETLEELDTERLQTYYLYHATRGELLRKCGRYKEAIESLQVAEQLTHSEPEKRFIVSRITEAKSALGNIAKLPEDD